MKRPPSYSESAESARRSEISRLRQMAGEAARDGNRMQAAIFDRLADSAAQMALELGDKPKPKFKTIQIELFPNTDAGEVWKGKR